MKKILSILMLLPLAFVGISCDDDDDNNVAINDNVRTYINTHYPGAVIHEAEYQYGLLEVDIYHDSREKEVYFDDDVWVMTMWDVAINALPEAVTAAIAVAYPGYRAEDAEHVETPEGIYYSIDLELGERDILVMVAPDGTIKE